MADTNLKFKAGLARKKDKTDITLDDVEHFLHAETEEDFEDLENQFNLFLFGGEERLRADIDDMLEVRNNMELAARWYIRLNKATDGLEITELDLETAGFNFVRNEELEYTEAYVKIPIFGESYLRYMELADERLHESNHVDDELIQRESEFEHGSNQSHSLIIPCGVYDTLNPEPSAVLSKALAELVRRHTAFIALDFDPTTRDFFCRYNDLMGALWHEMVEGWNASRVFACKYCGTIHFTKGERGMKREFCPSTQCANKYNNLHNKLRREAKRAEDALKEAEESGDASIIEAASEQVSRTEYALISFENDGGFHGRKE